MICQNDGGSDQIPVPVLIEVPYRYFPTVPAVQKKLDQHFFIEMIQLFFRLSEIRLQKLNFLNDWNDEKQTGCHTGQPVLFYEVL
jgi:hypothetical protein